MLEKEDLASKIRGCFFEVFREMGPGFLEKVYENALLIELYRKGLKVKPQQPLVVSYKDEIVGEYIVDLLVENQIIIELKAVNKLLPIHEAQILNYLKATDINIGLLVNFSHPKATVKRFVLS